jgi:hypothetical protein
MKQAFQICHQWYKNEEEPKGTEAVCAMRDVFVARLDTMYRTLSLSINNESEVSLLSAVVGEIGNNTFDHNLGQWRDLPGCWFQHRVEGNAVGVLIADRGQGVLSSLKRVVPTLEDDQQALEIAFIFYLERG